MSPNKSADELAIRQVVADWIQFTVEERVEELMDLMTDDMLFLTTMFPPMTKAEFEKGTREMVGKARIVPRAEIKEVQVEGNFGWLWQELTVNVVVEGKEPMVMKGRTMGIYRRCEDGKWRLMRDANMMP
ncbi:DUF4440 domain-containing protein [Terriglobus sp. YAF25]|uniref:YybH family protein n=1 Tax=Terriglobus sp. YAF25 TaxID=3233080 RepID=UPI003F97AE32